jgi:eukaryotic-like serine/threonine-protein kinase
VNPEPDSGRAFLIEILFSRAAVLDPSERTKFLDQACRSDDTLRSEIESLLAADTADDRFIESTIGQAAMQVPEPSPMTSDEEMAGRTIGPYRILELIGHGGMGTVYRAVRQDQFQMQVALKLIKRGADTDFAIRQFRNERQILAQLQHPNIARLLDAGVTIEDLPYFVMEYVEGQCITEYCSAAKLDILGRLRLFRSVCVAVQYAHQHLVIHRDLKPRNILITAEAVPKLLDFGIAKLLTPPESRQLSFSPTSAGIHLMTPDYASPEQMRGLPLTTATDIYSLGVVLYELLTGQRPYQIKTPTTMGVEQASCDEEPRSPSSVCKQIDRDLSKIILMALRKEPHRRYSSVEQFSNDIQRYLESRPILARKSTAGYRCGKFLKRHTLGVAAGVAIATGSVTGVLTVRDQAVRAQRRFQQVRKLANTMIFDLHDQIASIPGATKARQSLVNSAIGYLDSLAAEAGGDSQLQLELATAYERVGDVQGNMANSHLDHPKAAVDSYRKGLAIAGNLAQSRQVLELAARLYYKIGDVQHRLLGQPTEGRNNILTACRIADSIPRKTGAPADKVRAQAAGWLSELDLLRNPRNALPSLQKSLAIAREWAAADPGPESKVFEVIALSRLGGGMWQTGDLDESLRLQLQTIRKMEELLREHPDNVDWQQQMAICYERAGLVSGHPMYINLGDRAAAANWFEKEVSIFERLATADSNDMRVQFDLSEALAELASAVRESDPAYAEQLYLRSLALNTGIVQSRPDDALAPRWQAFNRMGLAWVLSHERRHEEAIAELEKALALQESSLARDAKDLQFQEELAVILSALGAERARAGDRPSAATQLNRALAILSPLWQANPLKLTLLRDLANCYEELGNLAAAHYAWNEARSWYAKSKDLWNTWPTIAPPSVYDLMQNRRVTRLLQRAAGRAQGAEEISHSR